MAPTRTRLQQEAVIIGVGQELLPVGQRQHRLVSTPAVTKVKKV